MSATVHEIAYRSVMRLYPASVRQEFGDEMIEVFCERIARRDDVRRSSLAIWLQELLTLPASLLDAYAQERSGQSFSGDRPPTRVQSLLGFVMIAAAIFFASVFTSRNVADIGLYNEISLVILVAGLAFGGVLYGVASTCRSHARRWQFAALASSMLFAALLSSFAADRALQRFSDYGSITYLRLPGVTAEFMHASTDAAGDAFVAIRRDTNVRRFRVETTSTGAHHYVRVLRAGGVDWLYGVLALMIIGASAHLTSRRLRLPISS